MLTPKEIEQLEQGLPDLREWSDSLLVPFETRRIRSASVLWINSRWFLERGLDVQDESTLERLQAWLISSFACVVPAESISDKLDPEDQRTWFADRYGSNSGLFAHGGSGRAAVVGKFNVKGVGPTPLVGVGVNREHSHGSASINVAIREAIYGEVFAAEFPHGAVPTLAIIGTGLAFESSSVPGRFLSRCLIVRPSMVRPAHMQRAPAFIRPADGHVNSQLEDVKRVKDSIQNFCGNPQSSSASWRGRLSTHFCKLSEQAAFGQIHRLYSGGYFTSNLCIDGSLLDFGNAHWFADWANAKVLDNDRGFGREMETIESSIKSLCFYFTKYLPLERASSLEGELVADAKNAYALAFRKECLRVWGAEGAEETTAAAITEAMHSLFKRQQKAGVNYSRSESSKLRSLYDELSLVFDKRTDEMDSDVAAIVNAISSSSKIRAKASFASAKRFVSPRKMLDRTRLQTKIGDLLSPLGESLALSCDEISDFVDTVVGASRRHWPLLPFNLSPIASVCRAGSSVLFCEDLDGRRYVWMEGPVCGMQLKFFDGSLESSLGTRVSFDKSACKWTLQVSVDHFPDGRLLIGGVEIVVPGVLTYY